MKSNPPIPLIGTLTAVGAKNPGKGGRERQRWCVDRVDGPQRVHFEALRAYAQKCGRTDGA